MTKQEIKEQTRIALRNALAKIEKPENWAQCAMAKDAYGFETNTKYPDAHSFCSIGAIYGGNPIGIDSVCGDAIERALRLLAKAAGIKGAFEGGSRLAVWNDAEGRTHAQVKAAFEAAIDAA